MMIEDLCILSWLNARMIRKEQAPTKWWELDISTLQHFFAGEEVAPGVISVVVALL